MHRRHLTLIAALAIVAAACTGPESDPVSTTQVPGTAPPSSADPPSTTSAPTTTEPPAAAPLDTGRLVVVNAEGNVVTMRPDGSDVVTVTKDASPSVIHFQPQWSPDGARIAWGSSGGDGFSIEVASASGDTRTSVATVALPFYLYWSPDSERVAVLHNSLAGGLEFELMDVGTGVSSVVAGGAPFYFSWDPDGERIVSHVGADDLVLLDTAGASESIGSTGQGYQAPQWTSRGIFHLDADALLVRDVDGASRPLATVPGPVTFVANPDGTRLAMQALVPGQSGVTASLQTVPEVPSNVVAVLDLATGEIDVAARQPSLGYFWSPDGSALLMLVPTQTRAEVEWLVWQDGTTRRLGGFTPQASFLRDVLQFFTQYAQSLRIWSPASDAFAFVGSIDGEGGVWVQRLDGSAPDQVAEGSWVAWSGQ
ncbi:MAG: hypothetical protein ACE5GC_04875 [Acidimicrobiia bacterium]